MKTTTNSLAISKAKRRAERVSARRAGIYGMGACPSSRFFALHKAEGRRYRLEMGR